VGLPEKGQRSQLRCERDIADLELLCCPHESVLKCGWQAIRREEREWSIHSADVVGHFVRVGIEPDLPEGSKL
jgi:hypothetical protein